MRMAVSAWTGVEGGRHRLRLAAGGSPVALAHPPGSLWRI